MQKVALARWSRTFSGTVSSGVPILQSVKITGQTSGNALVEEAMDDVYASVKSGGTIAHPIEQNPVFPAMVAHMVAVGEETGQLEHMLSKVADFYEAEVDAKVKALTSLLEPVMIVLRRRHRRLHRDLDVPADLLAVRQDPLRRHQAALLIAAACGCDLRWRPPVAPTHGEVGHRAVIDPSGPIWAL